MPRILLDERPKMFKGDPFIFVLGVLLIPLGVGLLILLMLYLRSIGERIQITEDTLVIERGILNKSHTEMTIDRIRTINVTQSFLDRILGVGRIVIYTAGDRPEGVIGGIEDPNRIRTIIRERQKVREDAR